jgi:glycosyltransferase involved in cell wall biosynthesis
MKPTIYSLPPRLTDNPYITHLHEALADRYDIHVGSLWHALWSMLRRPQLAIFHIHLFDEIIQRPQWFWAWVRMVFFVALLMILRWRGVHILWTVHNLRPHTCWHDDIAHKSVQHVINQSHALTCHHEVTRQHILTKYHVTIPISVVPHGHTPQPFGPLMSRHQARLHLGLDQEMPLFLCLGMIRPYKGIDTLIEAMHALPQAHVIIAGLPSDKHYLSRIHHQTAGHANISVKPYYLPDHEAAIYLSACDGLVLPYRAITTSGMLVHAQAAGVVCVVPDLPPLAEQVQDGVNGFVYAAGSVDDLVNTLKRLIAHPQRDTIGLRARSQLQSHTWEHVAKQMHIVYARFFDVTAH